MSAYDVAQAVKALDCGVSEMAVYLLVKAKGRPKLIYPQLLAALMEIFDVPLDELLVRDPPTHHAKPKKRL